MATSIRGVGLDRPAEETASTRSPRFPASSGGLNALLAARQNVDADAPFFVPTYLDHSVYMQQLQQDHVSKMRTKHAKRANGDAPPSNGTDIGALPPGSHRGLSHSVVERSSLLQGEEPLTPLPSRWNRDDMWGGIEVDACNIARYTAPKTYNSRDHEASAVRANHHMPPQCGLYYYEVTILDGKRDE